MATTTATKRVIATATTVEGNKEDNGNGGKCNGDGNEGGSKQINVALINYRILLCHDIFLST